MGSGQVLSPCASSLNAISCCPSCPSHSTVHLWENLLLDWLKLSDLFPVEAHQANQLASLQYATVRIVFVNVVDGVPTTIYELR
jgi:hypothetical protein